MGRRQRSPIARGLSLLNGSDTLGWWDMHAAAAVTALTVTATADVSTWSKSAGVTITAGIADADGGTAAYRVSVAATGDLNIRGPSNANFYSGFTRTSVKVKPAAWSSMTYVRWVQSVYGKSFVNILRASDETVTRTETQVYCTAAITNYGADWIDLGSGWRTLEFDELCTHVNAAIVRQQPSLLFAAPDATARDLVDIYQVVHTQERISAVADRKGGTALVQAANDARHTVIPGGWLGRDCAVGVVDGGSSSTSARAVGAGPWAVFGVLQPLRPEFATAADPVVTMTGATAAVSLTVTGGTAVARGTYSWSWTTDAGVTTTGTFGGILAAVPVAVALVYTGSVLRLYVDGAQVGTDQAVSGTATITGVNVRGQASQVAWTAWVVRQGAHSADQARCVSLALRSYANLPARWRLVLKSGQSNSTDTQQSVDRASLGRRLVLGQALSRRGLDALSALSYCPWYPATSVYWHVYGDKRQLWGGTGQSFVAAAVDAADYGLCVIDMGKGGEAISAWQAGGAMRTHTETQWPLAVADFGTTLCALEGIVWNQGEADAAYFPDGYQARLTDVIGWLRTLGGNATAWVVIQRLNVNIAGGVLPEDRDKIIAAQTAFVAADGHAYLAQADFAPPQYTTPHYERWGISVMGQNQYRARVGLAPPAP